MSTAKKPPKGFPPLPPVPDGWDAWELCGWGGLRMKADGTPWGCSWRGCADWNMELQTRCDAIGSKDLYYIRAIKRPTAKEPKGKRVAKKEVRT